MSNFTYTNLSLGTDARFRVSEFSDDKPNYSWLEVRDADGSQTATLGFRGTPEERIRVLDDLIEAAQKLRTDQLRLAGQRGGAGNRADTGEGDGGGDSST